MATGQDIDPNLLAIGLLAGLISESDGDVSLNLEWFRDPVASGSPSLANAGARLGNVVALVDSLLGPGTHVPVEGFADATWHAIPSAPGGAPTPFSIVTASSVGDAGQLGFGVLQTTTSGNVTFAAYGYVPLFSYDQSGAHVLLGDADSPIQLGVTATGKFQVDGTTFTSMTIAAEIPLTATKTPGLVLTFENNGTVLGSYTSLTSLLQPTVQSWIAEVVLQGSGWLDTNIGTLPVSIGDILVAANFLARDDQGNYSLDLASLEGLSPEEIALGFLAGSLGALSSLDIPVAVVELPGGGFYAVRRSNADGTTDLGIRLAIDVPLSAGGSEDGTVSPAIDLSIGTWLTGEDDADNWVTRSAGGTGAMPDPGLTVFLVRQDTARATSFVPSFALSSVGVDIGGSGGTPLLDIDGYTLQGVEVRAYVDLPDLSPSDWRFGLGARLDGLGFPLGPAFGGAVESSTTNPVASSLLSSGASSGGGDQDPVNPAFSASAAWVTGGSFVVQLYDQNDKPAEQVTIPVQRALGPLQCQSLGLGWVQQTSDPGRDLLSLLFTGGVSLAGLSVDLMGLSVGIPVTTPGDFSRYQLDLSGLGFALSAGEVQLSAALVKIPPDPSATPPRTYTEYDGDALLQAGTFAIAAVGSYAYVPGAGGQSGYASLFIFGILDGDLGGPEFFFVTGLAAGFGYNRALILPDQSGVTQFPLVAAASDPSVLGGQKQGDGSWQMPGPGTALAHLDNVVPPERGEYWLAAGVRFTSFDVINSTALLVVAFGHELEIALLGLSWISLPPPPVPGAAAPSLRYAYAELGIEVKLLPSEGIFTASAVLTPNSFVIDPACKLTGGFAFYVWFGSNPHAGEFVLTLGGYHPDFQPPSYYPAVPRLGFDWPMPGDVTISGDAYFALTPSAVMAGGQLQVLFSRGDLKAWFKAEMDALIQWAPLRYRLSIGVSIGVSYRAHLLFVTVTLKVELSASLALWGPEMGGRVRVNWYVISFSIGFGAGENAAPAPLDWVNDDGTGFAQTLLPHQSSSSTTVAPEALADGVPAKPAPTIQPAGIYSITVNLGLLTTFPGPGGDTVWVVRPNNFVFSVVTAVPVSEIDVAPAPDEPATTATTFSATQVSPDGADYYVSLRPMRTTLAASVLCITVVADDEGSVYDLAGQCDFDVSLNSVPAAKWGRPLAKGKDPEMNALLAGRVLGLANITPKAPALTPSGPLQLDIDITTAFTYDVVDAEAPYSPDQLPLDAGAAPVGPVPQVDAQAMATIASTLMDGTVVACRSALFAALQGYGIDPITDGPLSTLAAEPGAYLTADPLVLAEGAPA